MRNYIKTSKCPPSAQEIIDFANSIPDGYSLDEKNYPEGNDKQRKGFFEIMATLPNDFLASHHHLQKVLNNESISPSDALKQQKGVFFDEVRRIPASEFEKHWFELLMDNDKIIRFYPLNHLYMFILEKAIPCRRVLSNLNKVIEGFVHLVNGKPVLRGEMIKECVFSIDPNTGIMELAAHYPLRVIIGEKLDTRRFRICPICNIFFWAKRLDAKSCGEKKCVDKLSGKKYQNENKDDLNRKKRKKYYEDNGINFCPKCVRPYSTHGESSCQLNGAKK